MTDFPGAGSADRSPLRLTARTPGYRSTMLILGVVLLLLGLILGIPILWTIGVILAVIGVVLWILGSVGRPVGGRRWYY